MSLLWMEGFEYYEDSRYTSTGGSAQNVSSFCSSSYSRWSGGSGLNISPNYGPELVGYFTDSTTVTLGVAINFNTNQSLGTGNGWDIELRKGSNLICKLRSNGNTFQFRDSNESVLYTIYPTRYEWAYYEMQATVGASSTATLKINTQTVYTANDLDLSSGGASSCDNFRIDSVSFNNSYWIIDDLYIINDQGSQNNDFLGDCFVDCLLPNATGTDSDWTASDSTTHGDLSDQSSSTYASSSTVDDSMLLNNDDINTNAITGGVKGIIIDQKASYSGTHVVEIDKRIRTNSTTQDLSENQVLTTSATNYPTILEQNPVTTSDWTVSEINALEVGSKIISNE